MTELGKAIPCSGACSKADAVLASVRQGHRRVGAIAAASGLAPTTVLRVAALRRDHRKLNACLAPIRSGCCRSSCGPIPNAGKSKTVQLRSRLC